MNQLQPGQNIRQVGQMPNMPLNQALHPQMRFQEQDRRSANMEVEELDKSNPTIIIQKENVDDRVKQQLIIQKEVRLNNINQLLSQKQSHYEKLTILLQNLNDLFKIMEEEKQQMDFEQLKQYLDFLQEQYNKKIIDQNFKQLEKIKGEIKPDDLSHYIKNTDNIEAIMQQFEQLKFLHQDYNITSMLKNLLMNYQSSYQENLIIEMIYEDDSALKNQDRSQNQNQQLEEKELQEFIEHLNKYYFYKSCKKLIYTDPDYQRTGILLLINNTEPFDVEKYRNMNRVIIIQQFLYEQQSTIPEVKWNKTFALLDVTRNQNSQKQGSLFCMAKIKPQMQNLCEKFECQNTTKATMLQQMTFQDIITKFLQLTVSPNKQQNKDINTQIRNYMNMIKRQNNKVDCYELEKIGFLPG